MEQVKFLHLMIIFVQIAEGFIWISNTTSISVCVVNNISLTWAYTLGSGESHSLTSWSRYDEAGRLIDVADSFAGLSPAAGYVGRLTRIGNAGIQISNATSSDNGTYTVIVALSSGTEYTLNATVHVHEIANASCTPTCDSKWICQIPQACNVKSYIDAVWTVEGVKHHNWFKCSSNNNNKPYSVCAEGDAVMSCYSGPSFCHEEIPCIATTTTPEDISSTTTPPPSASTSTPPPSVNNTSTANGKGVKNEIIISVSVSAGVLVLVTVIIICCCLHHHHKRKKNKDKHKAHHAIAKNGSNERNELHKVTNTSQVDSCFDVSKVPNTKSDKGNSNAQIQSSTRI